MMNVPNQLNNAFLVVIPRNCTSDIHICGKCKMQYSLLSLFLQHKDSCSSEPLVGADTRAEKELHKETNKRIEVENLIEINELDTLVDEEKECNQFVMLNSLLTKDPTPTKQFKIDIVEGDEICITQEEMCLSNGHTLEQKLASPSESEYKRTLQNDEEDIATLLANQLSSETTIEVNTEPSVEQQADDPSDEVDHPKENEEKEENKFLYRGKMKKQFTCHVGECNYKTFLRKDIERHMRVHTGERPFKCYICNKAFTRTDKLLLHQRIHAGDKRYKCTKCDYAAVDSGSLIKHLRVHNDERPFKCQLCSYRSRDSSQLTVHLRTHTGDSPFICTNEKCKAAFKTSSDLKRHMIIHSGEKPHSCLYCPYKCTLKRNLQTHVQSQHPNGDLKEFRCHLCPRHTFPTMRRLKNHLRKSHGEEEEEEEVVVSRAREKPPRAGTRVADRVEKGPAFRKKRRKSCRGGDRVAVGVMNKAYDCKLCDASFVCRYSLLTHQRYHIKVEEEMRKTEPPPTPPPPPPQPHPPPTGKRGKQRRQSQQHHHQQQQVNQEEEEQVIVREEDVGSQGAEVEQKRTETYVDGLILNEGFVIENGTFCESLRNAEILASINPVIHAGDSLRQFVMFAPGMVQSAYPAEEYVITTT